MHGEREGESRAPLQAHPCKVHQAPGKVLAERAGLGTAINSDEPCRTGETKALSQGLRLTHSSFQVGVKLCFVPENGAQA